MKLLEIKEGGREGGNKGWREGILFIGSLRLLGFGFLSSLVGNPLDKVNRYFCSSMAI